jgi:hypothetical protein
MDPSRTHNCHSLTSKWGGYFKARCSNILFGFTQFPLTQVRHHPRTSGTSKYGLGRIFRVLLDLTTVYFWQRFRDKPMHFMGFLGAVCILGSLLIGAFASWSLFTATQRTWGYSMALSNAAPSYVLSAQLLIMGLQLVCLGLLAEICVRFEPQHRRHPYRVREVATSGTTMNHHANLLDKVT